MAPKKKAAVAKKPGAKRPRKARAPMTDQMRAIGAQVSGLFVVQIMSVGGKVAVRDAKGGDGINATATFENGSRMSLRVSGKPAKK